MHKPLISIGIPVVKSDYLIKSIESCLNQTYDNIEIIVQNNAKQQKIKSEIRQLVSSFSDYRIRYVEIGNQLPMVANWNSILEKANGGTLVLNEITSSYGWWRA